MQNPVGRDAPLHERVVARHEELSPTERVVARYLADHPDLVATASAIEIAELTGTSNATVVRTVKKLGYSGLPELKKLLIEMIIARRNPAAVLDERIDQLVAEQEAGPARQVLAATVDLLAQTQYLLDDEAWEKAVRILDRARAVLCYSPGKPGAVADFLATELSWNGCPARSLNATGFGLATGLLSLTGDEAVVLIAPLRHFREVDVVIDRAREVGAPVILISEALGMTLADRVDVVLATPQSTLTLTSEVLAPMTLAYAFTLDLAARNRKQAVTTYELVSRLRREVVGHDVDVAPPPVDDVRYQPETRDR